MFLKNYKQSQRELRIIKRINCKIDPWVKWVRLGHLMNTDQNLLPTHDLKSLRR